MNQNERAKKWRQEHKEHQKELVRDWNKRNPEKRRIYQNRFFEKKARERFGADYIPPENEQELSEQAKIVKNEYHQLKNREHRAKKKNALDMDLTVLDSVVPDIANSPELDSLVPDIDNLSKIFEI